MNPERAQSLEFRFINEDMLARKALLRPLFGWGGWGRSRVYNPEGVDVSITDGLWIIIFGSTGWLGVFSFIATFVLPLFLLWRRFPLRTWATPEVGPLAVVTVWLCIYMIDCLLNAMVNPVFALALGAVVGNAVSEYPPGEAEPVADEPADAETVAQAEARPRITAV
jgi:O-antigen ligase